MSFKVCQKDRLEYLCAEGLHDVIHCFSTRYGGVSQGVLASLNLGIHRGDDPDNVLENYRILGKSVGFLPEDLVFTHQTHSDIVRHVGYANRGQGLFSPVPGDYDGLVTNEPGVALIVFSADCTPILLYDPVARAIGAVHAGWRGTASGIVANAVTKMSTLFGSKPENIRAAIGPCIGLCCFETGKEVPEAMRNSLGQQADAYIVPRGEKYYVDLKKMNQLWLNSLGVTQVELSDDCTHCQPDRFWSHRITGNARGSQAAIIMLPRERSHDK